MLISSQYSDIVKEAIKEDIGSGDLSSAVIPRAAMGLGSIIAKQYGVICGIDIVAQVFREIDQSLKIKVFRADGDEVKSGDRVLEVEGSLRSILQGERTALNFLQHLSGVATAAKRAVEKVSGYPVDIVDTRKTLPGLRALQKYAVTVGGGKNHRFGLYDGIMLKDNHIEAIGNIAQAVDIARKNSGHMVKIEVECETLTQVQEALECKVDVIMLDNMTTEDMNEAVKMVNHKAIVEASGGITEDRLLEVAKTGVDIISLGALTHTVSAIDFSLDVKGTERGT